MSIQIVENHIALSSAPSIEEICKPLTKLGITYFSFVRSFKDGSHIRLSNNPFWTKHYYERGFYNVVIKQVPDADGNILWSSIDKYPLFFEASEYYDVDNGTVMVLVIDDVVERYFFGSTKKNRHVNNIYLYHLDILKRFILYFKEQAKDLIEKASKSKIFVPQVIKQNEDFYKSDAIQNFLEDIKIKKFCIRTNGEDIYISAKEAKILSLMKNGYTSKEISNEINLAPKTVEIYRDKLKSKLDKPTKGCLVSMANANSLLDSKLLK